MKRSYNRPFGIAPLLILIAGAMLPGLSSSSCKGDINDQGFPDISSLPPGSQKMYLRKQRSETGPYYYKYQSDYRGTLPIDGPLRLYFGRRDRHKVRMTFRIIGRQLDSLHVSAPDKSDKRLKCKIEKVKNRRGCTLRIESDAGLFFVEIDRPEKTPGHNMIEFYVNVESKDQVRFMR